MPDLLRQYGIASGTLYRWKSKYGGLKQLLDIRMLKDMNSKNW